MQNKLNPITVTSVIILFFFTLEWILYGEITFLQTANLFFYPAGIFLIIGLFSLVVRSGSFDLFHHSMNTFTRRFRKSNTIDPDDDEDDLQPVSQLSSHFKTAHYFFVKTGLILMSISILSLIGFYLFEQ